MSAFDASSAAPLGPPTLRKHVRRGAAGRRCRSSSKKKNAAVAAQSSSAPCRSTSRRYEHRQPYTPGLTRQAAVACINLFRLDEVLACQQLLLCGHSASVDAAGQVWEALASRNLEDDLSSSSGVYNNSLFDEELHDIQEEEGEDDDDDGDSTDLSLNLQRGFPPRMST
jgi:hypothetical protein